MKSVALLIGAVFIASSSVADTNPNLNATYILQVSSNLECESLDIEVNSTVNETAETLHYSDGAFSAVALPPGEYTLSNLTCDRTESNGDLTLSLGDKTMPFSVEEQQAYFGGELMIELTEVKTNDAPDALDNCLRGTGPSGGKVDDQCRDGVGVSGDAITETTLNLYAPALSSDRLDRIRTALGASEDQLIYMPIAAAS